MKKLLSVLLSLCLLTPLCHIAAANTYTTADGNYEYYLNDSNSNVLADAPNTVSVNYIGTDPVVNIPEEIDGMPVTKIGTFFQSDVTEVTIPKGVIALCSCFLDCPNLQKVTLPPNLLAIDHASFPACPLLTDIVLPDNILIMKNFNGISIKLHARPGSETAAYLDKNKIPYVPLPAIPYSLGDVDASGVINTVDVRMTLQMVVGKLNPTEEQFNAADVNGDGVVDTIDARMILQYIVGKPSFESNLPSQAERAPVPNFATDLPITFNDGKGAVSDTVSFFKILNQVTADPPIDISNGVILTAPKYVFSWSYNGEQYMLRYIDTISGGNHIRGMAIAAKGYIWYYTWTQDQMDAMIACID